MRNNKQLNSYLSIHGTRGTQCTFVTHSSFTICSSFGQVAVGESGEGGSAFLNIIQADGLPECNVTQCFWSAFPPVKGNVCCF